MTTDEEKANLTISEKPSAREKPEKQVINVPITVTISVPVEVDVYVPDEKKTVDEELGCYVVDPNDCVEAVQAAIIAAGVSEAATKAFDGLTSAAMRFQEHYPEVDVYITPFAGLIPEQKL